MVNIFPNLVTLLGTLLSCEIWSTFVLKQQQQQSPRMTDVPTCECFTTYFYSLKHVNNVI